MPTAAFAAQIRAERLAFEAKEYQKPLRIVITPCLLGFEVRHYRGSLLCCVGIYDTPRNLVNLLWHIEEDFTVTLR